MPKNILLMAVAALGFGTVMAGSVAPAQAQVGLEVGPGGVRVYEDRPHRPVVERRVQRRVIVDDRDEDCRVEVRRRVNRYGERVTRRVTVCE